MNRTVERHWPGMKIIGALISFISLKFQLQAQKKTLNLEESLPFFPPRRVCVVIDVKNFNWISIINGAIGWAITLLTLPLFLHSAELQNRMLLQSNNLTLHKIYHQIPLSWNWDSLICMNILWVESNLFNESDPSTPTH